MNKVRLPWYGLISFDSPIVAYVRRDGPCGDWIEWWSYVVLPQVRL